MFACFNDSIESARRQILKFKILKYKFSCIMKHMKFKDFNYIFPYIMYSALIFFGAGLFGYFTAVSETEEVLGTFNELLDQLSFLVDIPPVTLFLMIFFNNAIKTFITMIAGLFFGIAPAVTLFANGYLLGIVWFIVGQDTSTAHMLSLLLPHGIIEVPIILIASAFGFWLGKRYTLKLWRREPIAVHIKEAVRIFFYYLVPLLFVSAGIETFITPLVGSFFVR
jgi:stage II sporulation protein M